MNFFLVIGLALAPALFWMWWYYRKDVYDKEPARLLALVFILSIPLSVLSGLLEYSIDGGIGRFTENSNLVVSGLFYFGVVGVLEEAAKFIVVITVVYRRQEFNEPMDGIVYAVAAALGFATLENVFYIIDEGPYIILLRGPVSTLGHVLFSAMWGAALGLARFEPDARRRRRLITGGFLTAVITHGFFDVLTSLGKHIPAQSWLSLLVFPYLALLYVLVSRRISFALKISDFNPRNILRGAIANTFPKQPSGERLYVPNPDAYHFQGRIFPSTPNSLENKDLVALTNTIPDNPFTPNALPTTGLSNPFAETPAAAACPNCGSPLSAKLESKISFKCPVCGIATRN